MAATLTPPHPEQERLRTPFELPRLTLGATRAVAAPAELPAPVPAPVPVAVPAAPTPVAPTPVAPTPQPVVAQRSPVPVPPRVAPMQLPPRTHRDGVFGLAVGLGILIGLVALVMALSFGLTEEQGGRGPGGPAAGGR